MMNKIGEAAANELCNQAVYFIGIGIISYHIISSDSDSHKHFSYTYIYIYNVLFIFQVAMTT